METAPFPQLTGLLSYCYTNLRAHTELLALATADQILQQPVTYKVYERTRDGVGLFIDLKRASLPVLAIFPDEWEDTSDQIGDDGLEMSFGFQYLFPSRQGEVDKAREHKAICWAHAVLWALRSLLDTPVTPMSTYFIKGVCLDKARVLPPMGEPVRILEGEGRMIYTMPPWQTAPNSVPLEAIWGDLNEKGDTGAEPLEQVQYETGV